jgi:hypothetical protein
MLDSQVPIWNLARNTLFVEATRLLDLVAAGL